VGSDSDLETRIDEPAFQRSAESSADDVTTTVMAMQPLALLHGQTTRLAGDQVFVMPESEVTIICAKPDSTALDQALGRSIDVTKTGSLDPLRVSVENGALVLSRFAAHTSLAAPPVFPGEAYRAHYEQVAEWPRYKRLFNLLDHPDPANNMAFFSGNLASLGDSLYRLRSASVVTQNQGVVSRDTVRYELSAK
jgi:hypothetical protein